MITIQLLLIVAPQIKWLLWKLLIASLMQFFEIEGPNQSPIYKRYSLITLFLAPPKLSQACRLRPDDEECSVGPGDSACSGKNF